MAYTTHGHHIPGTSTKEPPRTVARCGGPYVCQICSRQCAAHRNGQETFDDLTLQKVYHAMQKVGIRHSMAVNAVSEMQNAGILFRERL